jgi:hypothetical protein
MQRDPYITLTQFPNLEGLLNFGVISTTRISERSYNQATQPADLKELSLSAVAHLNKDCAD